jgi:hypothetical protein
MAQRFLELGAPAEEQGENDEPLDALAAAAAANSELQPAAAAQGSAAGNDSGQEDAGPALLAPVQRLGLHRKKQAAQDVGLEERAGLVEACMALG